MIEIKDLESKIKNIKINNDIIIIFANNKFQNQVIQRAKEMEKLNIKNFIIISLDDKLNKILETKQINFFYYPFRIQTPNDRQKFWIIRINILYEILKLGFNILHMDADSMIIKNPFEIIDKNFDMNLVPGTIHPEFVFRKWHYVVRFGFLYCQSNDITISFFHKLKYNVITTRNDQESLNKLLLFYKIKWYNENVKKYIIKFRGYSITYFHDAIKGELLNNMKVILHPHRFFPRLKHKSNDPYIIDYIS